MKRNNWIWIFICVTIISGVIYLFSSSGMSNHTVDFAQAYLDKDLYQNALIKAKKDDSITLVFGELEPLDNLAILEGEVEYSNDNKTVKMSLRVIGSKEKGTMHILAHRQNEKWKYEKIDISVKGGNKKVIIVDSEQ